MNIIDTLSPIQRKGIEIVKYPKGKTIFSEKEECFCIISVIKGKIKVTSNNPNGEVTTETLNAGSLFGNNLIFSSDPFYKGEIIAKDDCTLALITKEKFLEFLSNNASFTASYLSLVSENANKQDSRIKILSFDNAQERLLYYLSENDGSITYHTVTDLSKYLGLSRESLSRLITKLIKSNIISRDEKTITLL